MKVLIACEFSGTVREAFKALGHDAWSCDLLPTSIPGQHIQGDILGILDQGWDLMIAHPPCTWLSVSGLHWNKRGRHGLTPEQCEEETKKAIEFAEKLWDAPINKIALENPVGCLSTRSKLGRPKQNNGQIIQPYQFGEDASKKTCIWRKNLPALKPTKYIPPRMVNDLPRWANQTDSGQNKLGPSDDRWAERSLTYSGIAEAMADQWDKFIFNENIKTLTSLSKEAEEANLEYLM